MQNKIIGFIGQGWIGKNYADDFQRRGYKIVRYGLEKEHVENGNKISDCDIVFIAVPTPTTPEGFDASILRTVIKKVGQGKIAVIKSTILPGTTASIQKDNPEIFVLHSPEFLTEATAAHDAANPTRNIVGLPIDNEEYREKSKLVLSVLPEAKFSLICSAGEAELIKYGGNNWFFFKVIFINLLYDLVDKFNCDWEVIRSAMAADPRIGPSHMMPVHKSGTPGGDAYQLQPEKPRQGGGRGAGGHCFIKDFAAFVRMYEQEVGDESGVKVLRALENKNIDLLVSSGKDLDLLAGVYGENFPGKQEK